MLKVMIIIMISVTVFCTSHQENVVATVDFSIYRICVGTGIGVKRGWNATSITANHCF